MPVTATQFRTVLIRRCGRKLAYAGMDSATVVGTNLDLVDPMREALASLGLAAADVSDVTDDDLAAVADHQQPQLLDVGELRCLESILGNRALGDRKALDSEYFDGRFYAHLELTVSRRRNELRDQYGYGLAPLTSGVFDLGFAATIDPATGRPH